MNTIDLVTSALAPDEDTDTEPYFHNPSEMCKNTIDISLEEVEQIFSSLPERLRSAEPNDVPLIVTQATYYKECSMVGTNFNFLFNSGGAALAMAANYGANPDPKTLKDLIEWAGDVLREVQNQQSRQKIRNVIGTKPGQIDLLLEFFPDDLVEELSAAAEVTKTTAKRWLDPNTSMTWKNARILQHLAKIFYGLKHEHKMTREEAVAWYRAPFEGGDSPAEIVRGRAFIYQGDSDRVVKYATTAPENS